LTGEAPDSSATLARLGLSRDTDITLTKDGRFLVAGVPFEHERVMRAFAGWLDRGPDGRYVLRNAIHWVRLTVEGAPLHAHHVEVEDGAATLVLASGEREPLRADTLVEGPDGALYARARDGTWPVRLSPAAALDLAPLIEDGPALRLGGRSWPIRSEPDPLTGGRAGSGPGRASP
jgi:hypothetical protein